VELGSLFDGSGGFPLAGVLCGIEPVWASEIEPYPIRVTKKNFPHMKHLGDITRIDGTEIEPVDVITFGSPCIDRGANIICMAHGQSNAEILEELSPTLNCNHEQSIVNTSIVRRLTPLECCRLQGFPDNWCEGVEGSDTAQYKMWGNGIALPCALYVMEGIAAGIYRTKATKQ
jgi:site-specific DNA-cytosine methylase